MAEDVQQYRRDGQSTGCTHGTCTTCTFRHRTTAARFSASRTNWRRSSQQQSHPVPRMSSSGNTLWAEAGAMAVVEPPAAEVVAAAVAAAA